MVTIILLQTLIKSFEVCDLPVRAAAFVPRKNWVMTGSVSHLTFSVDLRECYTQTKLVRQFVISSIKKTEVRIWLSKNWNRYVNANHIYC